ncbi:Hypothetical protein SRAE_2000080600 [Strongyloides ratti]|uniref:Uncharacterized protein n=1 Tax=Strongyloides ratti TaxID=34506 RepID=A0A090L8P2_STRRB|nr:Hypothetical protein SRAE_2000080600 [Strongyloides ratti]CEF66136.1 Hypothetical protein SRAE_2000080600 [Strongyloides ratti]
MNFLKNLGNILPSMKNNKNKKKLTEKDFSVFTKAIYEERKRRKKRYQEEERRKIRHGKHQKSKRRFNKDKGPAKNSYVPSNLESKDNLASPFLNPPNALLQLCKEKVLETKVDNACTKNIPENDTSSVNKVNNNSLREKKHYIPSNDKIVSQYCNVALTKSSNVNVAVHETYRNNKPLVCNDPKKSNKKPNELPKEKNLKLPPKLLSNDTNKKKKNFDSLGATNTAPTCKTIDIVHPYAILNVKNDVFNSKLTYLHKENNNNNWNVYDINGIPFWAPKLENDDDNTDDTTPDSIPLDSSSLIDIEQGKLELPECIEEPQDLNPFQPLRVMINRNSKYFENKLLCLITLRSMAALHLKDMPSKTDTSTLQSIRSPNVVITDNRECVSYSKWVPKSTFKCKYTGEIWPVKHVSNEEKN